MKKNDSNNVLFTELVKVALHALILSYYHPKLKKQSLPHPREIAEDAVEIASATIQKIKSTQPFDER
jgi:hypothetical protein